MSGFRSVMKCEGIACTLKWFGWIGLWLLTLLSFAPVLSLLASSSIANIMGCQLDEGSIHPCAIGGADFGSALNTGMVLGWLMLITWPGMLLTLGVWMFLLIRCLMRHQTKKA